MNFENRIEVTAEFLRKEIPYSFDTLLILGSGFKKLTERFNPYAKLSFQSIPHMPITTAPGHESNFYFSHWNNRHFAIMAGRFHYYEGLDFEEIAFSIYVFKKLGIKNLILTNASGGLTERIKVGEPVLIDKMISFYQQFRLKKTFKGGVEKSYAFMSGPNFGTRSEYRLLQKNNVDLVGMSGFPELLAAEKLDIKTTAISVPVCSYFPPESMKEPTENEVLIASEKALPKVFDMMKKLIG